MQANLTVQSATGSSRHGISSVFGSSGHSLASMANGAHCQCFPHTLLDLNAAADKLRVGSFHVKAASVEARPSWCHAGADRMSRQAALRWLLGSAACLLAVPELTTQGAAAQGLETAAGAKQVLCETAATPKVQQAYDR
jgi:hypothetical protein